MPENTWIVSDLVDALEPDPWRDSNPFSKDIEDCHRVLFDPRSSIEAKAKSVERWLANFQPCLSMNSVGHMARTRAEEAIRKNPDLLRQVPDVPRERLVHWALPKAMKTIGAPYAGSTRGTWLVERGTFSEDKEPPDFEEREKYFGELAHFSENRYKGLYHTDETIPSVYFNESLWRREDIRERDNLQFTYLHQRTDIDYVSMGLGAVIEGEENEGS